MHKYKLEIILEMELFFYYRSSMILDGLRKVDIIMTYIKTWDLLFLMFVYKTEDL